MADFPVGGVQINELPESSTIQSTDKLVIDRDGDDYSVTASQFSDKLEGTVSDAFDSTKAYSAGDYCIYNDVLYKFTSDKSAGSWSSSVVEATTVGEEVSELNLNINVEGENITVIYNNSTVWLFIEIRDANLVGGNRENTGYFTMPDNITLSREVCLFTPIMNSGWVPTEYMAFIYIPENGGESYIRTSDGVNITNAVVTGTFCIPKEWLIVK